MNNYINKDRKGEGLVNDGDGTSPSPDEDAAVPPPATGRTARLPRGPALFPSNVRSENCLFPTYFSLGNKKAARCPSFSSQRRPEGQTRVRGQQTSPVRGSPLSAWDSCRTHDSNPPEAAGAGEQVGTLFRRNVTCGYGSLRFLSFSCHQIFPFLPTIEKRTWTCVGPTNTSRGVWPLGPSSANRIPRLFPAHMLHVQVQGLGVTETS